MVGRYVSGLKTHSVSKLKVLFGIAYFLISMQSGMCSIQHLLLRAVLYIIRGMVAFSQNFHHLEKLISGLLSMIITITSASKCKPLIRV